MRFDRRSGFSLIELLVALVVLGLLVSMAAVPLGTLRRSGSAPLDAGRVARLRAVSSARITRDSSVPGVLFLPDGRAIGAGVDLLTGEVLSRVPTS